MDRVEQKGRHPRPASPQTVAASQSEEDGLTGEDVRDLFAADHPIFAVRTPTEDAMGMGLCVTGVGVCRDDGRVVSPRTSYGAVLLGHVLEGGLQVEAAGQSVRVDGSGFFLLDCLRPHLYVQDGSARLVWAEVTGVTANAFLARLAPSGIAVLADGDPAQSDRLMTRIVARMVRGTGTEAQINRDMTDLFYGFAGAQERRAEKDGALVHRAIAYICVHYRTKLSVDELARQAGMSVFRFIRSFERLVGMTPYAYIVRTRIRAAKGLLIDTARRIEEVGRACGFVNVTAFGVSFKKETGFTPYQWRRLHQLR